MAVSLRQNLRGTYSATACTPLSIVLPTLHDWGAGRTVRRQDHLAQRRIKMRTVLDAAPCRGSRKSATHNHTGEFSLLTTSRGCSYLDCLPVFLCNRLVLRSISIRSTPCCPPNPVLRVSRMATPFFTSVRRPGMSMVSSSELPPHLGCNAVACTSPSR